MPRLRPLFAALLLAALFVPAAATAQAVPAPTAVLTITGVAADNSSAKIDFTAVPGAKDYRVYDVANPAVVKYAGVKEWVAPGSFRFRTVGDDGRTPIFPLEVESTTGAVPITGPNLTVLDGMPYPEIEWNLLGDHQPHQLVVEAVDALGPLPQGNLYDAATGTIPQHPQADTMLGMDEGLTADGKTSINGQGPVGDNPQVLAASAPFTVQADPGVLAVPSGPDAGQAFFDTFPDAENGTIKEVSTTKADAAQPPGGARKAYTMGLPGGPQWAINYEASSEALSQPLVMDGHFMDVLFNENPAGSWATMAMSPQTTPDISGGRILHMTMEVDSTLEVAGRRWLGLNVAPASDPITDHVQPNFGNASGERANQTNDAIFLEIRGTQVTLNEYAGQVSPPLVVGPVNRVQDYGGNGIGHDNRSRFDLYLTQTHLTLYEDGGLVLDTDLPKPLAYSQLSTNFAHYDYHLSADAGEDSSVAPWDNYVINDFPMSDERHWDNMGQEVLPATDTMGGDLSMLTSRSQPPLPPDRACPDGWSCDEIGQPSVTASGVETRPSGAWVVRSGQAAAQGGDGDQQLLVGKPVNGDSAVTARLADHAGFGFWWRSGNAGVEFRAGSAATAPAYAVTLAGDGTLHTLSRTAAGGALQEVGSGVAASTPLYLRATRQGDVFGGQYSLDGVTWQPVANSAVTISVGDALLAGVTDWDWQPDTAQISSNLGAATFDHVALSTPSGAPPQAGPTIYDDTLGALTANWRDCSDPGVYTHYTMDGQGNPGDSLHLGLPLGKAYAVCSGVAPKATALDFLIREQDAQTDPTLTVASAEYPPVTAPLDAYLQGGATTVGTTAWQHVVVPFAALGIPDATVTRVGFVGQTDPQGVIFLQRVRLVPSAAPGTTPTPATPTPMAMATPTAAPATSTPTAAPTSTAEPTATAAPAATAIPAPATPTTVPTAIPTPVSTETASTTTATSGAATVTTTQTVTSTVTQTTTQTVTETQAASTAFSLACTRSGATIACTGA